MLYLLILVMFAVVVALRYKILGDIWWLSHRVALSGFAVGGIGFVLGFFGPMLLDPTSGNGPLLGIFITGPGGFLLGLCWGVWKEWERRRT